jgi:hypothetical protein
MDKETLSNYGWIVICVLVLAVMIALATPFGSFVSEAVQSTTKGLFDVNHSALESTGLITIDDQEFDVPNMNHGAESNEPAINIDMSTVSSTLAENDWATVQAVIKAGKIDEAGWKVGDISPKFTIDGKTRDAILIGINQDGANTATFMIQERVGVSKMRELWTNEGGFGETIVSELLNDLEGKTDIAQYMVSVNKNYYYEVFSDSNYKTGTDSGKLFLLSLEEVGLMDEAESYGYRYLNVLDMESSFVYEYFQTNDKSKRENFYWVGDNRGGFWLRSSETDSTISFFGFDRYGDIGGGSANSTNDIIPAFVIG